MENLPSDPRGRSFVTASTSSSSSSADKRESNEKQGLDMSRVMYWATVLVVMFTFGPWQTILKYGCGFFVCMVAYLFVNQNNLLYVPKHPQFPRPNRLNPKGYKNPKEIGVEYENVNFKTQDGVKLNAWLMFSSVDSKNAPTLLYFHGNAGNIGLRMPNYKELVQRCKANVFAVEYRGYGDSEGEPSERGLTLDGVAAWKYLLTRSDVIDTSNIVIFGRSLGGAVAIHLASILQNESKKSDEEIRPSALLLENTFTSVQEMAIQLFPLLRATSCIMDRLLENKWQNIDRIENVNCPILFLSGAKDNIVPPSHMKRLYELASSNRNSSSSNNVKMKIFPNSGHNDIPFTNQGKSVNLEYFQVITAFLGEWCG